MRVPAPVAQIRKKDYVKWLYSDENQRELLHRIARILTKGCAPITDGLATVGDVAVKIGYLDYRIITNYDDISHTEEDFDKGIPKRKNYILMDRDNDEIVGGTIKIEWV